MTTKTRRRGVPDAPFFNYAKRRDEVVTEPCGYKRNPTSSRPPCNRQAGHQGSHSYTPKV